MWIFLKKILRFNGNLALSFVMFRETMCVVAKTPKPTRYVALVASKLSSETENK